ncbi:MAG: hypothetical protein ACI3XA_06650 [Clostridia bacterium]
MNMEGLSVLMAAIAVCIGAVNIITEVLKAVFLKEESDKPLAVFIVSEVVCAVAFYFCSVMLKVKVTPLTVLGSVAGGFFIAYGAMYGYDNLYGNFLKNIESFFKKNEKQ